MIKLERKYNQNPILNQNDEVERLLLFLLPSRYLHHIHEMSALAAVNWDLGPGGFRSRSRILVDRNPRSRENVMRAALEELTGHTFKKIRPAFLRNPATNRCLELDAYCESLKLGAEFAGEQHRIWPNCCHNTKEDFDKQQLRDQLKVELCRSHGVRLIVVPDTVARNDVKEYVRVQLIRLMIKLLPAEEEAQPLSQLQVNQSGTELEPASPVAIQTN